MNADFYRSYHTHPINKGIHLICIPWIVISSLNLLSMIKINLKGRQIPFDYIIMFIYSIYYVFTIPFISAEFMIMYISILHIIAEFWRNVDYHWLRNSVIVFVFGWLMQFIGHFIEGNRPALLTSLQQAMFQAPLFSIEYILPFKLV